MIIEILKGRSIEALVEKNDENNKKLKYRYYFLKVFIYLINKCTPTNKKVWMCILLYIKDILN